MKKKICLLILSFLCSASFALGGTNQPHFVVVIPSFNNAQWCKENLESVFSQTYTNWSIIYINDASTDNTYDLVKTYIKERGMKKKCRLINNPQNVGALANIYNAVHSVSGKNIIVSLDGDDFLAEPQVFEKLAKIYQEEDIWISYGNYQTRPLGIAGNSCCIPIPENVMKERLFREFPWVTSHLRTFYAKLFHKIKKEDLFYNGDFLKVTYDLAIMFPMLEMASSGHIRYTPEISYIYNMMNPIQDSTIRREQQLLMNAYIRKLPKYEPLMSLFWNRKRAPKI